MKTKYLLLVLGIFYCMGIKAVEKDILLYSSINLGDQTKDKRSISIEPTATIEEKTMHIQTNLPVEQLQIEVTDENGNTVYSNNDVSCSRSHVFEMNNLLEGEYIIELVIRDESFYGYFSIP